MSIINNSLRGNEKKLNFIVYLYYLSDVLMIVHEAFCHKGAPLYFQRVSERGKVWEEKNPD